MEKRKKDEKYRLFLHNETNYVNLVRMEVLDMKNKNNEKTMELMTGIGYKELEHGRKKERRVIQNLAFSDGTVIEKETLPRTKINADHEMAKLGVEEIELQRIKIKDASYIIIISTIKEDRVIGNLRGNFDTIKNVEVYMMDQKDKEAKKKIQKTLKYISDRGKSRDYSSIAAYIATYGANVESEIEYQRKDNIFILKKEKD